MQILLTQLMTLVGKKKIAICAMPQMPDMMCTQENYQGAQDGQRPLNNVTIAMIKLHSLTLYG